MSLKRNDVALFEKAIDDKIARAQGKSGNMLATVTRVDNDGTTWVHVYGGAEETPVRRMTAAAQVGDTINVVFSGLSCIGVGNVSSPAASEKRVTKVESESANAIAGVIRGVLQVRQLLADKVSTEELEAEVVTAMLANIDTLVATLITSQAMKAAYAEVDFANVQSAQITAAKMNEIMSASGWFNEVTITGDQSITGQLKSVLIDGDTARFRNIFADSINVLGEDGFYHRANMVGYDETREIVYAEVEPVGTENPSDEEWYELSSGEYVPTEDTTVDSGKTYYARHYDQVTPEGWENPSEKGWYVIDDGKHVLTDDTEVDSSATYYTVETEYSNPATKAYWDSYQVGEGNSLDSGIHGSHIIAESVTATQINVDDLISKMLTTQNVTVGAPGGFHIEIDGTELGFYRGVTKVAYVSGNELYIPRTVVLNSMQIGNWKWVYRDNGNLTLQWVGA